MKNWILVANSSYAEVYEHSAKGVKKINLIDFPMGRIKSGEILSDRPGRSFARVGSNRHALGTEVDVHTHEQQVFAHQIAEMLLKSKNEHVFDSLIIIAPPQFLGELRQVLPDAIKKCVTKEFNKDIPESNSENERIEHICKLLEIKKTASISPWE